AQVLGSPEYFSHFVATPPPPVTDQPAVSVPGTLGQDMIATFTATGVETAFDNEFGIFPVDDASGRIGSLRPRDDAYAAAAVARSGQHVVFAQGPTIGETNSFDLPGGTFIGLYLVQNSTTADATSRNPGNLLAQRPLVFFSFASANPDRFDHV